MNRKIIFLDIDGVLNCRADFSSAWGMPCGTDIMEKGKIDLLKQIVDATAAELVLHSSWRLTAHDRRAAAAILRSHGVTLSDQTPMDPHQKFESIQLWLARQTDVKNYIIIDDETSEFQGEFPSEWIIKTTWEFGLTPEIAEKAIEALGRFQV